MVKVDIIPKKIGVVRKSFKATLVFRAPDGRIMVLRMEDNDDITMASAIVYKLGLKLLRYQQLTNDIEKRLYLMLSNKCYPLTTCVCIQPWTGNTGEEKRYNIKYYDKDGKDRRLDVLAVIEGKVWSGYHLVTPPKLIPYLKRAFLFLRLVGEYP